MKRWAVRTELPKTKLIAWLGVGTSKFYTWQDRYGQANEHNGKVPRDFWLEDWEKRAILDFHDRHPLDGYRRLTFRMLDDDVVAVSPSSRPTFGVCPSHAEERWPARQPLVLAVEERHRLCAAAGGT